MKICSIASSSSGNSIYVGTDSTHILIDSGISGKRLKAGLDVIGIDPSEIDAVLITHEHSDHIKGLGVVSRRYGIPIYATERTWSKIQTSGLTGNIDEGLFHEIVPDTDFFINDVIIHPFNSFHDAVQPVCYTFRKGGKKISVATDLGCYNSYIADKIKDSDLLFIEANHDIDMLKKGSYPYYLKKRILSDTGHLSNEMSARLISEVMHENLRYVVLGHLSKENNIPELARETVLSGVSSCCASLPQCTEFIVSEKESVSPLIEI
ncbi:MAG TPA: MBL fold metallo-hydrolase [Spirochaetota bacterium]|nr:MBL fold metallo-hydrolase [Spirochaetota bacterium]HPJ33837.1 MBL fold metallo-hydrolase [Spirochaetota bacterium]